MQVKTIEYYDYVKDNKKFTELLVLLKDYKEDSETFNDYYELIKTSNIIRIKRVKKLFNIIIPIIVSLFLLFITMMILIALIQNYDTITLSGFLMSLVLTIGWSSVPYSEIMKSDELHYFNAIEYVYSFEDDDSCILFDDIYGFFLTYILVQYSADGAEDTACYKLNMVLRDGTVRHIIAELFNRDDLLEDAKTIALYTQKPLYDFKERNIAQPWRIQ